jgi:hypothetical protein
VTHRFRNNLKDVRNLPRADTNFDHNLLLWNKHSYLKIVIKFQKLTPRSDLEKLYAQRQKVQSALEEIFGAIEYEIGNVEMQWQ